MARDSDLSFIQISTEVVVAKPTFSHSVGMVVDQLDPTGSNNQLNLFYRYHGAHCPVERVWMISSPCVGRLFDQQVNICTCFFTVSLSGRCSHLTIGFLPSIT
jgi:hypothetical protein